MADFQHGFYKQNMLINGDFQCNQRGSKSYDADGKSMYSVDMWRAYNVKVDVLNEGVKVTGKTADTQGYFTQFIQLGKLKTTTYTISAMADDKICTFTVTPGGSAKEKSFGTFKITALTTSKWDDALNDYNNKLKINICPIGKSSITFQYIDVFEGVVAYPHVKEDPATAMMRCRRYLHKGTCFSPILQYVDTTPATFYYRFGIPIDNMAGDPTLEACSWLLVGQDGESISGGVSNMFSYYKSSEEWQFDTSGYKYAPYNGVTGFRIRYTLSCEPQDA
jgi:hypothetical protein